MKNCRSGECNGYHWCFLCRRRVSERRFQTHADICPQCDDFMSDKVEPVHTLEEKVAYAESFKNTYGRFGDK